MKRLTIRQLRSILIIVVLMIVSPFEAWSFDEWADSVSMSTDIHLKQNEIGGLEIFLTNDNSAAGLQITFAYDSTIGVDITEVDTTSRTSDFEVLFVKRDDDPANIQIKVLLYSLNADVIAPGDGAILRFTYQTTPAGSGETLFDFFEEPESVLGDLQAFPILLDTSDGKAFFASNSIHAISGRIRTNDGEGIPNVIVDGFSENPTTDENGYYETTVGSGWSGVVTPKKAGYTFTPIHREYSDIKANYENQNYVGTPEPCLNKTVCNGNFEQDFMHWSSTENVKIATGRNGNGIQVSQDGANSDVFQFMKPDDVLKNNIFPVGLYKVSAWCLADAGEQCGIYLGDANTWYNPPDHERESRTFLNGNGQWQQISTTLTLDEPELLSVYLYAKVAGSSVVYDDVAIEELTCDDNTVCNGDFTEGLTFWRDTENASLAAGRSGQALQVAHDGGNNDVYQFMTGVFAPGSYQISAWCKADVGEECGIYLGDANDWHNPPAHEREVRQFIPGNGEWQRISAMLTLDESEMLSVYLYAKTPGSRVLYDDISITPFMPSTAYLAEGYTKGGFNTTLLLLNPHAVPAQVDLTFMKENGDTVPYSLALQGKRRVPLIAKAIVGEEGFSTQIESTLPIVTERSMYWEADGIKRSDGHNSPAMSQLGTVWYFAEGFNSSDYSTVLLLVNPQEQNANVTITLMQPDGSNLVKNVRINAHTRLPIVSKNWIPSGGFATKIVSDIPIMTERAMYWYANGVKLAGGHNTTGVAKLSSQWYFAEGRISSTMKTVLMLMNPHAQNVKADIRFLKDDGSMLDYPVTVKAGSRMTLIMKQLIDSGGFATVIDAEQPIVAERAMYWDAGGVTRAGGHVTVGATAPDTNWYFAEGLTNDDFNSFILLMNPGSVNARVNLSFLKDDGTSVPYSASVNPGSRLALNTKAIVGSGGFATILESDQPIVAERAMYWSAGGVKMAGGHCSIGTAGAQLSDPQTRRVSTYLLTVEKGGSGSGTIRGVGIDCGDDCTAVYPQGALLNLKAVADEGSTFTGWLVNGAPMTGIITVDAPMTVTGMFERQ